VRKQGKEALVFLLGIDDELREQEPAELLDQESQQVGFA
jgi:hypothetical protein